MENPSEFLGPNGLIRKDEFVRVIAQSLHSLGYHNSASLLESESGVSYKSQELRSLEPRILNGDWDGSAAVLNSIKDVLGEALDSALFLVLRQCFVEHVSRGDTASALGVLRESVPVLHLDKNKVKSLTRMLITLQDEELGAIEGCDLHALRRKLLKDLEKLLPPPISLPERRLEHLVESAVVSSMHRCMYHNSVEPVSLYEDHHCPLDKILIPNITTQTLTEHRESVWFVQFSNNGEFLASSSNDRTIIWKVDEHGNLSQVAALRNLTPVCFMAWSSDDTKLLVYGEQILKLWDIRISTCTVTYGNQLFFVNSCAWFPDSSRFLLSCSGPGQAKGIYVHNSDVHMKQVERVSSMANVAAIALTPDGEHFICTFTDKKILVHHIGTRTERVIYETHPISSLTVSRDSLLFLVTLANHEIHLWDVAGRWSMPLCFVGYLQQHRLIRSCIGGWNCRFIAGGSEDWQVYIWNRNHPRNPLLILVGHSDIVNSVSWNPRRPQMLASASDDGTVRIWGPSS